MSNSSEEQDGATQDRSTEDRPTEGITDDKLPEDLRPTDDNPLAKPLGDDDDEESITGPATASEDPGAS